MIRTLRVLFLGRLLREKLMLVALAVLATGFWASKFIGRLGDFVSDSHRVTLSLEKQSKYLNSRASIEAAAQRAASSFDPAQTLDSTRLLGKVSGIANQVGLTGTSTGIPQDTTTADGKFSTHSVEVTINRETWDKLNAFCWALEQSRPYIQMEQFRLVADRANPSVLTANVTVTSVEITPNR